MTAFAAPASSHAGRLVMGFDEDALTLAFDAIHAAKAAGQLPTGARLASDVALPKWLWAGLGLIHDEACERRLRVAHTQQGPVAAVLAPDQAADPNALAAAALAMARPIDEAALARIERARNAPDGEADYPLGAFVTPQRHDEVLEHRLGTLWSAGTATVRSWTTIGAGAAPSEFARLQDAQGAYHVLLVDLDDGGRTVGIATQPAPPATGQRVRPVVRRLYRSQGAWRYGVKFAPA